MGQSGSRGVKVQGKVAPGYESVKKIFQENFDTGREENAQLCVYVGEEVVVDLWGSSSPDYTADTLTTVFSSTKSLTAIALAWLYDQGLLDYDARITEYWPQFGQNGKEDITVADLMRHEAGLPAAGPVPVEDCLPESIQQNKVGTMLESEEAKWAVEGKRAYHAFSRWFTFLPSPKMYRGWIANEVFRRVHPEGSTIGSFVREKISKEFGARVFVGVHDAEMSDYAPVAEVKASFLFGQSLRPKSLGRGVDFSFFELCVLFNRWLTLCWWLIFYRWLIFWTFEFCVLLCSISKMFKTFPVPFNNVDMSKGLGHVFNQEIVRRGEVSSANGNCSARGLGKVAASMANGGSLNGFTLLSNKGWQALHSNPTPGGLGLAGAPPIHFTQGGLAQFKAGDGHNRDGFYGWIGYGGSVFQWEPQLKVGFAYVPTLLEFHCMANRKGARLQEEVLRCVRSQMATKNKQ